MIQFWSRRPRRLVLLTACLMLFQFGAAVRALQVPADLAAQISLSLPMEFVASGFWALLFALFTLNLIRLTAYAQRHAILAITGFITYSAARLVLFTRADYDQQRLPLLVIATIIFLIVVYLLRRSTSGENQ
jgi:hypothetical protein